MNFLTPVNITFIMLFVTVGCLWIRTKFPFWIFPAALTLALAFNSGVIDLNASIFLLAFGIMAFLSQNNFAGAISFIASIMVIALGVMLTLHLVPGFNNLKVLSGITLSPHSAPYTMYLNFDKTMVGIFILGFGHSLLSSKGQFLKILGQSLPIIAITATAVAIAGINFGFLRFEPKLSHHMLLWAATNLMLVCVAEEALFRGFIQPKLAKAFNNTKLGTTLAIITTAILFGLLHFKGGNYYMLLATIAGLGYGFAYAVTNKIEASILTHFGVNLLHILFFTYPTLK